MLLEIYSGPLCKTSKKTENKKQDIRNTHDRFTQSLKRSRNSVESCFSLMQGSASCHHPNWQFLENSKIENGYIIAVLFSKPLFPPPNLCVP